METVIVCFELTMPKVNSWDGKWSGAENKHYIFEELTADAAKALVKVGSWKYDFGDGWEAQVSAKIINERQEEKMKKVNKGFAGYNWMVESILRIGKITG